MKVCLMFSNSHYARLGFYKIKVVFNQKVYLNSVQNRICETLWNRFSCSALCDYYFAGLYFISGSTRSIKSLLLVYYHAPILCYFLFESGYTVENVNTQKWLQTNKHTQHSKTNKEPHLFNRQLSQNYEDHYKPEVLTNSSSSTFAVLVHL